MKHHYILLMLGICCSALAQPAPQATTPAVVTADKAAAPQPSASTDQPPQPQTPSQPAASLAPSKQAAASKLPAPALLLEMLQHFFQQVAAGKPAHLLLKERPDCELQQAHYVYLARVLGLPNPVGFALYWGGYWGLRLLFIAGALAGVSYSLFGASKQPSEAMLNLIAFGSVFSGLIGYYGIGWLANRLNSLLAPVYVQHQEYYRLYGTHGKLWLQLVSSTKRSLKAAPMHMSYRVRKKGWIDLNLQRASIVLTEERFGIKTEQSSTYVYSIAFYTNPSAELFWCTVLVPKGPNWMTALDTYELVALFIQEGCLVCALKSRKNKGLYYELHLPIQPWQQLVGPLLAQPSTPTAQQSATA